MKVADWQLPSSSYADRSSSTAPMPCATPPRIWPSTMAGLMSAPQSSATARWRGAPSRGSCHPDQESAQARPQVVDADRDHKDAHHAPDQDVRKPPLYPGTGIGARQAADAQRYACGPVRGNGPVMMN